SEEQVVEALQMLEAGKTQRFVARYFGVGASTIFEVAHNQSRQHIPGPRVIVKPPQSSRYFGVTRNEGKWVAHIRHKGTLLYFGRYAFEVDAAICVNYHVAYL